MSKKGLFISFEGGEGLGKSTLTKRLADELRTQQYTVRCLREPGGTPIGEEIRHTLKSSDNNKAMVSEAELLLMNASRAQLVGEVIRPALAAGEIIVCDRFYDSTVAYQGYGRGLNLTAINQIIDFAVGTTRPDITFWIDGTPTQGRENRAAQIAASGQPAQRDRIEEADIAFFERVYQGFRAVYEGDKQRVKQIPYIHGDSDLMYQHILSELNPLLPVDIC